MRNASAKSIRKTVVSFCKSKQIPFSKNLYRKAKREMSMAE